MTKGQRVHNNAHLVWLCVSDIEMAPVGWGRPVRRSDVRQIGFNLDPDLFGFPVIWEREDRALGDGRYTVIDGQHRIRAVVDILKYTTELIQCEVFRDIPETEAARISLGHQERRNLHPYDRWRAAYMAGDKSSIAIAKAAADAGLAIRRNTSGNHEVVAVNAMIQCWERIGYTGLVRLLVILSNAWEGTAPSFSAKILRLGMILIANYDHTLDDVRLSKTLSKRAPSVWLVDNTPRRRHLGFIAQDVVAEYNNGLRTNRLQTQVPDEYVAKAKRSTSATKPRPKVNDGGVEPGEGVARVAGRIKKQ